MVSSDPTFIFQHVPYDELCRMAVVLGVPKPKHDSEVYTVGWKADIAGEQCGNYLILRAAKGERPTDLELREAYAVLRLNYASAARSMEGV